MANPYHDPKTGKFTSGSGLNRANSTLTQRGKARVKEHISAAGAFAVGAASLAVGAAGAALLQGITRPIRARGHVLASQAIRAAEDHAARLVATHGPTIAAAVKAKGSDMLNHVKNMKIAGKSQHNVSSVSSRKSAAVPSSKLKSEAAAVVSRARTLSSPTRVRVKAPTKRY